MWHLSENEIKWAIWDNVVLGSIQWFLWVPWLVVDRRVLGWSMCLCFALLVGQWKGNVRANVHSIVATWAPSADTLCKWLYPIPICDTVTVLDNIKNVHNSSSLALSHIDAVDKKKIGKIENKAIGCAHTLAALWEIKSLKQRPTFTSITCCAQPQCNDYIGWAKKYKKKSGGTKLDTTGNKQKSREKKKRLKCKRINNIS